MVALAPHLVRPLTLVVPAFEGARPDRLVGMGLNMYDVLSLDTPPPAPRGATAEGQRRGARLEPRPPPHRSAARRSSSCCPRSRRASRRRATCSTTARPTTCGSCSPCSARPSASARYGQPARGRPSSSTRAAARRRARASTTASGERFAIRPPTSSTRPACGPTACAPRSSTTRPRCRRSGRAAARTSRSRASDAAARRRRDRPRRRRAHDLRAALAGPDADRHDRQRLRRRRSTHIARRASDVDYLLDAANDVLRHRRSAPATSPAPTRACGR